MSRRGISKLGLPKRKHDPSHSTDRDGGRIHFETFEEVREEDRLRVRSTRASARERYTNWDFDFVPGHEGQYDPLSQLLLHGFDGDPQPSCASKIWMRDRRRALAGGLWRLQQKYELDERFFVIMPRCWEIPSDELLGFDPRRIIKPFRAMLQHYGSDLADGYLFAGIDGEFYEPKSVFRLHLQGIATGGMIEVVERLRKTRKFKPTGVPKSGRKRTVLQMKRVNNRPEPYTYAMKSSWFVNSYLCPEKGKEVRLRKPRRIPDPHQGRYLHWLDQWPLKDLTVMVGVRVGKKGLAYPSGESNRSEK